MSIASNRTPLPTSSRRGEADRHPPRAHRAVARDLHTEHPLSRAIRRAIVLPLAVLPFGLPLPGAAAPQGGVVVGGSGAISRNGNLTIIQQGSQRMAVDWQSYNIGQSETVRYNQPSASAAALNTVLDGNPSQILGRMEANGQVFLMNPSGIIFGEGAQVHVGSLVAGAMAMDRTQFMNGVYEMELPDGIEPGMVVNRGLIEAATGGSVTLVGGAVANEGTIIAELGQVNLGAGNKAIVDFDGTDLIRFEVDGEITENVHQLDAAVSNTGSIEASTVIMAAQTARDVFTAVVNNSGVIRARGIDTSGGEIRLTGGGGLVSNSGTLDASGTTGGRVSMQGLRISNTGEILADGTAGHGGDVILEAVETTTVAENGVIRVRAADGGIGGSVKILGAQIALVDDARIDASGADGGGEVLIGGDLRGANPDVPNADETLVEAGVEIDAHAVDSGDGGKVIVWADDETRFAGSVGARGGEQGGDGGFVEVSGEQLVFSGLVDTLATDGEHGMLLLDPATWTIQGGSGTDTANTVYEANLEAQLTDIVLEADLSISSAGTFTDSNANSIPDLLIGTDLNLTLRTTIANPEGVDTFIDLTGGNLQEIVTQGTGDITLYAGIFPGDVVDYANILLPDVVTRDLTLTAGGGGAAVGDGGNITTGAITARTLDITNDGMGMHNSGTIRIQGNLTVTGTAAGQGMLARAASYDLALTGQTNSVASTSGAAVAFANTGALTLGDGGDDSFTFSGGLTATAPTSVAVGGSVAAAGTNGISIGDADTSVSITADSTVGDANTGAVAIGAIVLASDVTLTVENGSGDIQLGTVVGTAGGGDSNLTIDGAAGVTVDDIGAESLADTNIGTVVLANATDVSLQRVVADTLVLGRNDGTLEAPTGEVGVAGNLRVVTLTTLDGSGYDLTLTGSLNQITVSNPTTLRSSGALTLGDATGDRSLFSVGVDATAASVTNLFGDVDTNGSHALSLGAVNVSGNSTIGDDNTGAVTLGNVVLADDVTLTVENGADAIVLGTVVGTVGGGDSKLTLDGAAGVTVGAIGTDIGTVTLADATAVNLAAVTADTLALGRNDGTLEAPTGPVAITGNLQLGGLTTEAGSGFALTLGGDANVIGGQTTLQSSGALTLGDGVGDSFTFSGGLTATAPTSVAVGGNVAAADNNGISIGDGDTSVSITADSTVGDANTGAVTLGDLTIADGATLTVGGGSGVGNNLTIGTVTGANDGGAASNLAIDTVGAVTSVGAIGTNIGTVTVTDSGGVSFGAITATDVAVTDSAADATVALNGTLDLSGDLTTAAGTAAYDVSLTGTGHDIEGKVEFRHTGGLTLGSAGGTILIRGAAGLTASGQADGITLAGTVRTSADPISLTSDVTLAAAVTLDTLTGAGDITLGTVSGGGNALTLDAGTGTVTANGALTNLVSLDVDGSTNVALNGGATVTNAVSFGNSGALTLGDGVGDDSFTFSGGLTATAPTSVAVGGSVAAADNNGISIGDGDTSVSITADSTVGDANTGAVTLGDLTIADGATLTVGGGSGVGNNLTIGTVTGANDGGAASNLAIDTVGAVTSVGAIGTNIGTVTVTDSGGVSFGAITATDVAVTDSAADATVALNGTLDLSGDLTTAAGNAYDVSLTGTDHDIEGKVEFRHTGGLTLGSAGDTILVHGAAGLTASGQADGITLAGTVRTSADPISLTSDVTLAAAVTLDTLTGAGDITLGTVNGGGNALTLDAGTGTVTANGALTNLVSLDVDGSTNVALNGGATVTNAVSFGNSGTLTLGDGVGDDSFTFSGGLTATVPTSVAVGGSVAAAGTNGISIGDADTSVSITADSTVGDANTGAVAIGAIVLASDVTLTVENGSGDIQLGAVVGTAGGGDSNLTIDGAAVVTVGNIGAASPADTNIGTVVLANATNVSLQRVVADTLVLGRNDGTLEAPTGEVHVAGNLGVVTLTTLDGSGYDLKLTGSVNQVTVAAPTTLRSSGVLTLGDQTGDQFTFRRGVDATAASVTNLFGDVDTNADADLHLGAVNVSGNSTIGDGNTGAVTLGNVVLADDVTLTVENGADAIVLGTVVGTADGADSKLTIDGAAGVSVGDIGTDIGTVTLADATDVNLAAVTADTLALGRNDGTLEAPTGPVAITGNLQLGGLTTEAGSGFALTLGGDANVIGGQTTLQSSGALTLGGGVGDSSTFTGGLIVTADPTTVTLRGEIAATDAVITIDRALTLSGDVTIDTDPTDDNTGGGAITLGAVDGGGFDLTLDAGEQDVTTGAIGAAGTIGAFSIAESGTATVAAIDAESVEIRADTQANLNGNINTTGTIGTTDNAVHVVVTSTPAEANLLLDMDRITVADANILLEGQVGLKRDMSFDTTLGTDDGAVVFNGTWESIGYTPPAPPPALEDQGWTLSADTGNEDLLTPGAAPSYAYVPVQVGALTLSGTIPIPNTDEGLEYDRSVVIGGDVLFKFVDGATQGLLTFNDTVITDGTTHRLTVDALGDVTFVGAVGTDTDPFGAILIEGAANLSFADGLSAASLSQTGGDGTTRLSGTIATSAAPGVSITAAGVTAIILDDAVIEVAVDSVAFHRPVLVDGDSSISATGTATIAIADTVDAYTGIDADGTHGLVLSQASGAIPINADIGNTSALGALRFASDVQLAGTGARTITAAGIGFGNNTADAGSVELDLSGHGLTLNGPGGATADDGAVTLSDHLTITNTGTAANLAVNGTLDALTATSAEDLTLALGTGSADFDGDLGATDHRRLGTVTVTSSGQTDFAGITAADLSIADGRTAALAVAGGLDLNAAMDALSTGDGSYTLSLAGPQTTIAGETTFGHAGSLQLGGGATDSFTFTGGLIVTAAPTTVTLQGAIAATDSPITIHRALTLGGDTSFDAGTGTITLGEVSGGTNGLTIADAGNLNLDAVTAGTLALGRNDGTLEAPTGLVDITGNLQLGGLTTEANSTFALTLSGDANIIGGQTTLQSSGALTLGGGDDDSSTFTGGLIVTAAPTTVTLRGDIAATNAVITMDRALTLGGDTSFDAGTGTITLGDVAGGTNGLTIADAGNLNLDAVTAGTLALGRNAGTLEAPTGLVDITGNLQLDGLTTEAGSGFALTLGGDANVIGGQTTLQSSGALSLGGGVGDSSTFTGGLIVTADPTTVTLRGEIAATDAVITMDRALTLGGDTSFDAGTGTITLGDVAGGTHGLTIADAGNVDLDAVTAGTLALGRNAGTLEAPTGPVVITGNLQLDGLTTESGSSFALTLSGDDNDIGGATRLQSSGTLTVGDATTPGDFQFTGGLDADAATAINLFAGIATTNAEVSLDSALTLGSDVAIDTDPTDADPAVGGGAITLGAVDGGGFDLTLDAGEQDVTTGAVGTIGAFSIAESDTATVAAIDAESVEIRADRQVDLTGDIETTGDVTITAAQGVVDDPEIYLNNADIRTHGGDITFNGDVGFLSNNTFETVGSGGNDGTIWFQTADGSAPGTLQSVGVSLADAYELRTIYGTGSINDDPSITLESLAPDGRVPVVAGANFLDADLVIDGAYSFSGDLVIGADVIISSNGATPGNPFNFTVTGRIDAETGENWGLTLRDLEIVTINGAIGTGESSDGEGTMKYLVVSNVTTVDLGGSRISTDGTSGVDIDATNIALSEITIDTGENGDLSLTGDIDLGGHATLVGKSISLDGSVDGDVDLILNSQGITSLGGAIGGDTPLASLTTDASGSTEIDADITTTGAIAFNDAVQLNETVAIATSNAAIAFTSIDSEGTESNALTLTAGTGAIRASGAIGASGALGSLEIVSAGSVDLDGNVTTDGDDGIDVTADAIDLAAITLSAGGNGGVTLDGPVTLSGTVTVAGSRLDLENTVDGGFGLILNSPGVTSLGGAIGGATPLASLTTDAGGSTEIDADITTTGAIAFNDAAQLNETVAIATSDAAIAFTSIDSEGTESNALTLTAGTGAISASGAIGASGALGSLEIVSAGSVDLDGNVTTDDDDGIDVTADAIDLAAITLSAGGNGGVTLDGPVTLSGTVTVAGSRLDLENTVDGGFGLILNSPGVTTIGGALGGATALASLTTDAGGSTRLGAAITTQGAGGITFNDAVVLDEPVAIATTGNGNTAGAAITFASTLDSAATEANGLTLNAGSGGNIRVTGAVGADQALGAIEIDNANDVGFDASIEAASLVQTAGSGTTTLSGDVTTTAAPGVDIDTAGIALAAITVDAGTNGGVTLSGPVDLTGDVTLAGNAIDLEATVDGNQALHLNSPGVTTIGGALGGNTALASLTTDAGGSTRLGAAITTQGAGGITFNDAVVLDEPVAIATTGNGNTAGAAITFASTLDSAATEANGLTLNAGSGGDIRVTGAVGADQALGAIEIDNANDVDFDASIEAASLVQTAGSGTTTLSGDVTTTAAPGVDIDTAGIALAAITVDAGTNGGVTLSGPVDLTGDVTLAGNAIDLEATVDGNQALHLNSPGVTTIGGALGGDTALASLTTDAGGSTRLGAAITTQGAGGITFNDAVVLDEPVAIATTGNGNTAGAAITFASTLDSAATEANGLTLNAGSGGNIRVTGAVGADQALGAIEIDNANDVGFDASIEAASLVQTAGSGTTTLSGDVTTTAAPGVDIDTAGIALAAITVDAGTNGGVTLSGPVDLTGDVTLAGNAIDLEATVDGNQALHLNSPGVTTIGGARGGNTALASLTTDAGGSTRLGAAITTQGAGGVTFNDAVVLDAPVAIATTGNGNTAGAAITFASTLDSAATEANGLTLNAGSGGNIRVTGAVGADQALGAIEIDNANDVGFDASIEAASLVQTAGSGTTTLSGEVTTTAAPGVDIDTAGIALAAITVDAGTNGGVTLSGPVDLTGDVTLAGNAIDLEATVDGNQALHLNSPGVTTIGGALGGNTALASLTTDAGGSTRLGAAITTQGAGGITFNDAVVLDEPVAIATTGNGNTAGAAITFASTLDSAATEANGLTLNAGSGGDIRVTGAVGADQALGAIEIDNANDVGFDASIEAASLVQTAGSGTTTLSGEVTTTAAPGVDIDTAGIALAAITVDAGTNGGVTLSGPVDLTGDVTLAGNAIDLEATVDGNQALHLNSPGVTTIGGAIGGATALASLTTDAGGSTRLGAAITTQGAGGITFNDAVVLDEPVAIATTGNGNTAGAAITFASTLDSAATEANGLTLNAGSGGDIRVTGAVGAGQALGAIEIDNANDVGFDANIEAASLVQTAGSGTTTLSGDVTTTAAPGVDIDTAGIALAAITVDAGTNGGVTLSGPVDLTGDVTLAGNAIDLEATVDGNQALHLNSPGVTTIGGALGGATALASLTTDAGGSTRLGAAITTQGAGGITFNDAVVLDAPVAIATTGNGNTAGAPITFASTLDSAATEANGLTLNAGSGGDIQVTGAVGAGQALGAIEIDNANDVDFDANIEAASLVQTAGSGTTTLSGDVTTTGAAGVHIHTATLTIADTGSVTATGGDVSYRTDTGDITLGGATTADGRTVTMNAILGAIDGAGVVTAQTVDLDAFTGIGATTPLELAASIIDANTWDGNISITNTLDTPTTGSGNVEVGQLVTGTGQTTDLGNIVFRQLGAADLLVRLAQTTNGSIDITGQANVTIEQEIIGREGVLIIADGDLYILNPINGGGSLVDLQALGLLAGTRGRIYGDGEVRGAEIQLSAKGGIGVDAAGQGGAAADRLNLFTTVIDAETDNSDIFLSNTSTGTLTLMLQTNSPGDIDVIQQGGGTLLADEVLTANGSITLHNSAADLRVTGVVTAGGGAGDITMTTGGDGNVALAGTTTAAGNQVTIDSDGAINGSGLVTAQTVALIADTGIGDSTPLELAAANISARTDRGDIDFDNTLGGAVRITGATSGDSDIRIEQFGSANLTASNIETPNGYVHIANRGTGNLTVLDALAGRGDVRLESRGNLEAGDVSAGGSGSLYYTATRDIRLNGNGVADGNAVVLDAGGSILDLRDDEQDFAAARFDFTAGRTIGSIDNPIELEGSELVYAADADVGITAAGDLEVQGSSSGGETQIIADAIRVDGDGIEADGLQLFALLDNLDLNAPITFSGDAELYGANAVFQNADITGQGGVLRVFTDMPSPTSGPAGEGITMAAGTITENLGGSIEYLANNTVSVGFLSAGSDGSIQITAVGGDIVGTTPDHGISAGTVTLQAINGQIGGGQTDPLRVDSIASQITAATDGQSYIVPFGSGAIDSVLTQATEAIYSFGGVEYRISTFGGQVIILSSVGREAAGSVQQASEEELEDVNDALLQDEIEIYTLEQPGICLPADQLEDDGYDGAYAGVPAPVRNVVVEVGNEERKDCGWADAPGWEAADAPLPGQASGPTVEVELSVPGLEVEARAATAPVPAAPETAGPQAEPAIDGLQSVDWQGPMPPFPGAGYRYEPRLAGLPW